MSKYFKSEKDYSTYVNCGIVFNVSFREFDKLKERLKDNPDFRLVYHRASLEKLFILTESEIEEIRGNGTK